MLKPTRMARMGTVVTALATIGVLSLAGCSPSSTNTPTDAPETPAADGCGSIPQLGANDPSGLLDGLSAELKDGYNAYDIEIQESAWSDWKSEKTDGYTAAIVGQAPAAPYIATFQAQLLESLEAQDIEVVANLAPNDPTDVPGQIQMFNQALSLKPDIIFLNPAAPEAALDLVAQAHDAGIPVVSTVVPLDSPYAISLANNSNLQAMETAAGVLGAIGGTGTILQVDGVPGIPPQLFWEDGIQNALELCPDVTIAGQVQGFFQPPAAQQAVVQYLATNPAGVDAVFQAGSMGWAIRDAFQQAGLEVPPIQDINASQGMAAFAAANPDYPYFGTATPPIPAAKAAAQIGIKVLAGAGPKVNQIVWGPYVVDRENIDDVVDPSWSESDGTDLAVEGVYLTDDQIAEFFNNPELGPQSAE
ncbi:substrate-binding domain-containing protein [Microbacterium aurantiacum]|uniref:substrate-binding domain-containing protein n=1 Tax=Microbacterium aurantiacum TaxID=162393 RepID=UPI003F494050